MTCRKRKVSLFIALTLAVSLFYSLALTACSNDSSDDNSSNEAVMGDSVNITETFGATGTSEASSPVNGDNYTWGDLTVISGFTADSESAAIDSGAISLTANSGKKLITFKNGIGGVAQDISMSFDGSGKDFGQENAVWDLIYKDTKGTEMFRVRHTCGNWTYTTSLVANNKETQIDLAYSKTTWTPHTLKIEFVKNGGGIVTMGDTKVSFTEGSNLGSIEIEKSGSDDWSRPFVIDNIKIATIDKRKVTFTLSSSRKSSDVKGAVITINGNTYTVGKDKTASCYLPDGDYEYSIVLVKHNIYKGNVTVSGNDVKIPVKMEYIGKTSPERIEISGGEEYIYKPAAGQNTTVNPFTAVVYDNIGLPMNDEEVEWSIIGDYPGVSIDKNGIVTVTSDFPVADNNGSDLPILATVKSTKGNNPVTAQTTLHVRNVKTLATFDIAGPLAVKNQGTATYKIINAKDQYGEDMEIDSTPVFTSNNSKVTFDGSTLTANTQIKNEITVKITATVDSVSIDKEIVVYGYDFYEPGVNEASYGSPRMETINGEKVIVWQTTSSDIVFPEPIELAPGSAKKITYKTAWTNKQISAQERGLKLVSGSGNVVLNIGYYSTIGLDAQSINKIYTFDEANILGNSVEESTWADNVILIKTDAEGVSTATISYNNGKAITRTIGKNIGSLTKITLAAGKGIPEERMLGIKDIKIVDSNIIEVEILGDDQIAKISGGVATKTFKKSVFSQTKDEEFIWSVAAANSANGESPAGVRIDQDGVLYVEDTASLGDIIITLTSSIDPVKYAVKTVTINDFAAVQSFEIKGSSAINAGETGKYSVQNIKDQYGDIVNMRPKFAIISGEDIASIDPVTGVITTSGDKCGTIVVSVTVGNPGKELTLTKEVTIDKFSYVNTNITGSSTTVDVTSLANYSADTTYRVTVLKNDGTYTIDDVKSVNGKIVVNTANAKAIEVSPNFFFDKVGYILNGFVIKIPDGLYDFTFVKTNKERSDIFVNGALVGNNVGQYGKGRSITPPVTYTAKDIKVEGDANIVMKDKDSAMTSITVKKAPSIIPRKPKLYVLGDSLVAEYYGSFADPDNDGVPAPGDAQTGWGQVLQNFVTDDIEVVNLAESGNYAEGLYNSPFKGVIANGQAGDYLLLECGYNDKNYSTQAKMTTAVQNMIDECRAKGIIPILVTPNASAHDFNNSVVWSSVLVSIAKEKGTFLVDLSKLSYEYLKNKGVDWAKMNTNIYYDGASQDTLHASYLGAYIWAETVMQNIADQQAAGAKDSQSKTLDGIHINKNFVKTLTDAEGNPITLQVQ